MQPSSQLRLCFTIIWRYKTNFNINEILDKLSFGSGRLNKTLKLQNISLKRRGGKIQDVGNETEVIWLKKLKLIWFWFPSS